MKKIAIISFFFILSTSVIQSQEVIGATNLVTSKVDSWLKNSFENIERLRARAIMDANLAAEQRIMQLNLALQNLKDNLLDKTDEVIGKLDRQIISYIRQFDKLLQNALNTTIDVLAERMDLILNTALNDLCANSFICSNKKIEYNISYINNTLVRSNAITSHIVEIGGTAISNNSNMEVSLNGAVIDKSYITKNNEHIRLVSIPSSLLKFKKDTINRMKLKIKVDGERRNKKKKWFEVWKPKYSNEVLVEYSTNLILLPINPVRIELIEHQVVENWEACGECELTYLGSTKNTVLTSHSLPIGNDFRLKKIVNKTKNLYHVVGHDYYYFYCSEPRMYRTPEGYKIISTCFDGKTGTGGSNEINQFYSSSDESIREKMFYHPYKNRLSCDTNRFVMFTAKLDKKSIDTEDIEIGVELTESIDGPSKEGYLTYGDHWSEELKDVKSGYTLKVYPTFGNNKKDFIFLTPLTNDKKIGNFARIQSSIEHLSNESLRVKISVD